MNLNFAEPENATASSAPSRPRARQERSARLPLEARSEPTYTSAPDASDPFQNFDPQPTNAQDANWQPAASANGLTATALRHYLWEELRRSSERVSVDPHVKDGEPTITGTRISLSQLYDLAATGLSARQIADEFDGQISEEDVQEAFRLAAQLTR